MLLFTSSRFLTNNLCETLGEQYPWGFLTTYSECDTGFNSFSQTHQVPWLWLGLVTVVNIQKTPISVIKMFHVKESQHITIPNQATVWKDVTSKMIPTQLCNSHPHLSRLFIRPWLNNATSFVWCAFREYGVLTERFVKYSIGLNLKRFP